KTVSVLGRARHSSLSSRGTKRTPGEWYPRRRSRRETLDFRCTAFNTPKEENRDMVRLLGFSKRKGKPFAGAHPGTGTPLDRRFSPRFAFSSCLPMRVARPGVVRDGFARPRRPRRAHGE